MFATGTFMLYANIRQQVWMRPDTSIPFENEVYGHLNPKPTPHCSYNQPNLRFSAEIVELGPQKSMLVFMCRPIPHILIHINNLFPNPHITNHNHHSLFTLLVHSMTKLLSLDRSNPCLPSIHNFYRIYLDPLPFQNPLTITSSARHKTPLSNVNLLLDSNTKLFSLDRTNPCLPSYHNWLSAPSFFSSMMILASGFRSESLTEITLPCSSLTMWK